MPPLELDVVDVLQRPPCALRTSYAALRTSVIEEALYDYCIVNTDIQGVRLGSFVKIMNRCLELAPGTLPGIPQEKPYPIADICFADISVRHVECTSDRGPLTPTRLPGVALLQRADAERLTREGGKIKWTDIISFCEVRESRSLSTHLEKEQISQKLPGCPLGSDGVLEHRKVRADLR